ncbi:hypothetical protein UlMin_033276 [Ulmus minor]
MFCTYKCLDELAKLGKFLDEFGYFVFCFCFGINLDQFSIHFMLISYGFLDLLLVFFYFVVNWMTNGMAGMTASLFSQALFVPIDVISQKLMVQGYSGHAKYSGGLDVAHKILKANGMRGFYRGFGLSVSIRYDLFSLYFLDQGFDFEEAPSLRKILLVQASGGIIAGTTASCITTPLDTIKTRLQVMGLEKGHSARQVIKGLIKDDGWLYECAIHN